MERRRVKGTFLIVFETGDCSAFRDSGEGACVSLPVYKWGGGVRRSPAVVSSHLESSPHSLPTVRSRDKVSWVEQSCLVVFIFSKWKVRVCHFVPFCLVSFYSCLLSKSAIHPCLWGPKAFPDPALQCARATASRVTLVGAWGEGPLV